MGPNALGKLRAALKKAGLSFGSEIAVAENKTRPTKVSVADFLEEEGHGPATRRRPGDVQAIS
jgi:hypothetical protein